MLTTNLVLVTKSKFVSCRVLCEWETLPGAVIARNTVIERPTERSLDGQVTEIITLESVTDREKQRK